MSDTSNKPTHNVVRFYGEGRNSPKGNIGAMWENDKGGYTIVLNFLDQQIVLQAFSRNTEGAQ